MLLKLYLSISILVLSACATSNVINEPIKHAPDGLSRIVIYWPDGAINGRATCPTFKVSSHEKKKLPFGGYTIFDVPPGVHTIMAVTSWCSANTSTMKLVTEPNQVAFARLTFTNEEFEGAYEDPGNLTPVWIGLIEVSPSFAKSELRIHE